MKKIKVKFYKIVWYLLKSANKGDARVIHSCNLSFSNQRKWESFRWFWLRKFSVVIWVAMMWERIHATSSSTKSVDRMATLISIFAFLKRQDVSLIHRYKKFVMVRAALILIAVRLTSHQRINIQTIAYFGITNADISWSVFSANLDDLSPSLEICPCPASSNDLF